MQCYSGLGCRLTLDIQLAMRMTSTLSVAVPTGSQFSSKMGPGAGGTFSEIVPANR
jgi:hypothetical protein